MSISIRTIGAISFLALSFLVQATQSARAEVKKSEKQDVTIQHDRVRGVDLNCDHHQVPEARKAAGLDQERLLLAAVRNKPFPKLPLASLGWFELGLKSHGLKGSLTDLKGPAQMAAMRLASLADNDYMVASQMAYGVHMRQGLFPKSYSDYMGYFIIGLTEDSDQTPETNNANAMIAQSMVYLDSLSPSVKGYARWVMRAYAYDDLIAIDASMAGVCMSSPTKTELDALGKAIRYVQFNPKRDYTKPQPAPKMVKK